VEVASKKLLPIKLWATLGAVILAGELYVLARWVTGPYFKRVPSGPSVPPTWMKVVLNTWQALSLPALVFLLYWFAIRPWRRERRLTIDGLLCVVFLFLSFQDPLSSYINNWFTYNSYLVNFGSWVKDIPGWMAAGKPGAMVVEPILFTPAAYVYFCLLLTMLGCWVMRWTKARWQEVGPLGLVAGCYAFMVVCDFVIEGLIWLPLGFFEYPGGHLAVNASHYYKFPLHESLFLGVALTAFAALRYFKDDKGYTLVERGVDQVRATPRQKNGLRFLAVLAVVQLSFLAFYNLPSTFMGARSASWPRDLQKRSYFTDYICGAGTDRACPGPNVPLGGPRAPYLDPSGNLIIPKGTKLPQQVPFDLTRP
jgi:hypothetical protein